jgi:hypothetical protein
VGQFVPPFWLRNAHLQTIYPTFFRSASGVVYQRERLELPDGDFMDLDWSPAGGSRLGVLLHGLASCSGASYILGMTRALNRAGWDALAINMRGASGEPNRLAKAYHSGSSDDLRLVVDHVVRTRTYRTIAPIGFSLGGSVVLRYLGESPEDVPREVEAAAAVSVPCDLAASADKLTSNVNAIYMRRFIRNLYRRFAIKAHLLPPDLPWREIPRMRSFAEYDEAITAPLHGFAGAEEYWETCSAGQYVPGIRVPTLLIMADDDPFFTETCYPSREAEANESFHLEITRGGGHLGFVSAGTDRYWHERRILEWVRIPIRTS